MTKRLTTEECIRKCKETFPQYDYSKVHYTNNTTKVEVICPKHGSFMQYPNAMMCKGVGCPSCAAEKRKGRLGMTTEEWISRARRKHGGKYDYSRVVYAGNDKKVIIGCPEHGWFEQEANAHLQGFGCQKCGGNYRPTTEDFIAESKKLYPGKINYDKCQYVNAKTNVTLYCTEKDENGNEHGYYTVNPGNHLRGTYGCKKCQYESVRRKNAKTNEQFISESRKKFDGKFKYDECNYKGVETDVILYCTDKDESGKEHGYFTVKPDAHLNMKNGGCPKCHTHQHTTESWIKRAKLVHGETYDYSKTDLDNRDEMGRVLITCRIHGDFWQNPGNHLQGMGCYICNCGLTKENKLKLLTEYDLENMSHHQLMELISVNALPGDFKKLVFSEAGSKKRKDTIKELQKLYEDAKLSEEEAEDTIEHSIEEEEKKYEEEHTENTDNVPFTHKPGSTPQTKLDKEVLPSTNDKLIGEFLGYDRFSKQLVTYGEKNKFLSAVEIQKIWNRVLKEDTENSKELISKLLEQRETSSEWLSSIIDEFMKEYDRVQSITQDKDYKFDKSPSLMQKLMVYKLIENDSYLNLCGTGAGKTNAFLMASRAVGAKYSVIVCPNGVKASWVEAIEAIYPSITTVEYNSSYDLKRIQGAESAYIIINYDKFSNGSMCTKDKMDEFIDTIHPQFVCFDELHNAKAASEDASLRNENLRYFRQKANEVYGEDFKTLGMTATPLINNLNEVRSLLELVTGKEFSEIGNRNTIENIHIAYKNLLLYGFRFVPDYGINVVKTEIDIDGTHLKGSLFNLTNNDVNIIEGLFVNAKMEAVKNDLTQGTIIYSTFIKKIVPNIKKKLNEFGVTYAEYTGNETANERKSIFKAFANKKFKVLVASSPITTGVEGLQKFSNKIILISLPWTNADYTQLIGRINRQGSVFDEVNIIFPRVNVTLKDGSIWSWDNGRMNIIRNKKTLSDAVVDGEFSHEANISKSKLVRDAIDALHSGEAVVDFELNRQNITPTPRIGNTSREYTESVVNETHRRANTEVSSTTHKYFLENKSEWRRYHESRDRIRAEWGEDPQDVIAAKINGSGAHGIIADFGCGRNELKGKVTSYYDKWLSFDHVANDETVIEADTTNLSEYVADESLDVAVYCLSIWGRNKIDYFKEASRVLKRGGTMYVAEPTDKVNQLLFLADAIGMGFQLCEYTEKGKFTYFTYAKK